MIGYGRVVDVLLEFRIAGLSMVPGSYNNQDLCFILHYNKMWMNNRGTCSPHILKHCGAITGTLNIPAQHDTACRSPDWALLL